MIKHEDETWKEEKYQETENYVRVIVPIYKE